MTCLFHDVHKADRQKWREPLISGMIVNEVLYSDDSICITQEEEAMNKIRASVEQEGRRYGMKLSKTKCEHVAFRPTGQVHFEHGTPIPRLQEVRYLG